MPTLGVGQRLHLRLFIEGVEVPVIGAMVSANEGSPAAAQIEVIPSPAGMNLLARSKVHLFYLDYEEQFVAQNIDDVQTNQIIADLGWGIDDQYYKLLFTGEVFTKMFTKSGPGSRSLILQCLDDSNLWDTSYLYQLRYSQSGNEETAFAGNTSAYLGLNDNANQLDDILNSPELVIRQFAARQRARSPSLADKVGLMGGLFSILELIGGVEGKYIGISGWHTVQEARIRLMDQLAGDSGATSVELFDQAAFESWLTGRIGDAGSVISFRELIDLINSYIYYSVFPNPVAVYKPGERNIPAWPEGLEGVLRGDLHPEFEAIIQEVERRMKEEKGWDGTQEGKPAIRRTSGFRSLEKRNSIRRKQGRSELEFKPGMAHDWGFAQDFGLVNFGSGYLFLGPQPSSLEDAKQGNWPPYSKLFAAIVRDGITTRRGLIQAGLEKEVAVVETMAAFYIDLGDVCRQDDINLDWGLSGRDPVFGLFGVTRNDPVHVQLKNWRTRVGPEFLAMQVTDDDLKTLYGRLPKKERLFTQYFRPDVWFCAPPLCNVVFPEEVSNLTYTQQMMRETTRLQLTTFNSLYEDVILNQVYFAPRFEQVESLAAGGIGSAARAILYPHEKFSGIVPKMERISEVAFYTRLTNRIPGDRPLPEVEEGIAKADEHLQLWAERTAAFNFLTHRYAARSLVASGRFMPRLVCGWPACVIEQPMPPESPEQRALREGQGIVSDRNAPVHYLGIIKTLSHSITQAGGGTTSFTMSHARSHKVGDETDDLFSKSIFGESGLLSTQVTRGEPITTEITVRSSMIPAEFKFCQALTTHLLAGGVLSPPPRTINGPKGQPLQSVDAAVVSIDAFRANETSLDPDLVDSSPEPTFYLGSSVSDPETLIPFPFSSVTVTEAGEIVSLKPIEEAIRPPWFSDEYANANIGTLYDELFGCGSVLDAYNLAPINGYTEVSVAQAVDQIARAYSAYALDGGSAASFTSAATRRQFASLSQVLGSGDSPGFHGYASGDESGLSGPQYEWMRKQAGQSYGVTQQVNPREENAVDPQIDPRRERYRAALDYRAQLLQYQGLRG